MGAYGISLPGTIASGFGDSPSSPIGDGGLSGIPLTLPDGTTMTYVGDPSQMPDIFDASGMPVPLAPARPNASQVSPGSFTLPDSLNPDPGLLGSGIAGTAGAGETGAGGLLDTLTSNLKSVFSRSVGDYVAIIIGIVLIGGALLMFDQTRGAILETARRGAELAA